MKYSFAAISAFVALVVAKPAFLNSAFELEEGKPFEIKYSGCEGGCTIVLQNGESDDTKDVETLTSSAEGSSFTFTPKGLPSDTYNFKITNNDSGEENFSAQFEYKGTGTLPTTGTTTVVSSTGSASESTASTESTSAASTSEASSTLSLTTVTSAITTESKASSTHVSTSSIIVTVSKNATTTHATSAIKPTQSASKTEAETTTAAPTGSATTVPDSGAVRMTSSLALIAGAVMAMIYLN